MDVMLLRGMLAYNLLRIFFDRNLKPVIRDRVTRLHICQLITADFYAAGMSSTVPS